MSSDQGPGTPSFEDLFDDPDAPLQPVARPVRPVSPPVVISTGPAMPAPVPPVTPAPVVPPTAPSVPEPAPSRPVEVPAAVVPAEPVAGRGSDAPTDLLPDAADGAELSLPPAVAPDAWHDQAADDDAAEHEAQEPDAWHLGAGPAVAGAVSVAALDPDEDDLVVPVPPVPPAPSAPRLEPALPQDDAWDGHEAVAPSSAPAARVDTGRLYRSAGAEGPATLDAIPAIDPGYRPSTLAAASAAVATPKKPDPETARVRGGGTGLTYTGVVVVVVGATVLLGFADAIITKRIGLLTCLALLVSSVYAALVVRRGDIWAAVVVPPLAFLAALLTAGQLTLGAGSKTTAEGFMVFQGLSTNAPWVIGTTLVCLVIVLVRRRSLARAGSPT